MAKQKSDLKRALGKLISAIQKEWGDELGVTRAAMHTEDVMGAVHVLLQAADACAVRNALSGRTLHQYPGEVWLRAHPSVLPAVERVSLLLCAEFLEQAKPDLTHKGDPDRA